MNKTGMAFWMVIILTCLSSFSRAVAEESANDTNEPAKAAPSESTVYQVYRAIDLGESDTAPPKDIFVNIGSDRGIKRGTQMDVYRRIASFDNLTQKHMSDHMIPVGRIKVIHVDDKSSIARLEKFVSINEAPALLPQAIMIGDLVRPIQ